jgi:hypothetical protein
MMRRMTVLVVVVAMFAMGGCSQTDDAAVEETTSAAAATTTVESTTTTTTEATTTTTEATTTEAVEVLVLRLTFDGESCLYEGPTVLAAGPVELVFVNESERYAQGDISRLTGNESLQDMIDYMGDPPSPFEPPWADHVNPYHPVNAGKTDTWEGNLEAGIHITMCIDNVGSGGFGAYFATGLTVEP